MSWSIFAAVLLVLQATVLAVFPRLLLFLVHSPTDQLTPLESFLALHFALSLFAIALTLLLHVCLLLFFTFPVSRFPGPFPKATPSIHCRLPCNSAPSLPSDNCSKYICSPRLEHQRHRFPLLHLLFPFLHNWCMGFVGGMSFSLSLPTSSISLLQITFANSTSISKSTGADKHTSAFIFGNKAAASSQKKKLKK